MKQPKYKRVLLKLSGEALMGDQSFGIAPDMLAYVAEEIKKPHDNGVQLAIVVGGGNIFRGVKASSFGMERTSADHMGMLATVINGLALRDMFEAMNKPCILYSSLEMRAVARPYNRREALKELKEGSILIFAGGTGRSFFTTDTSAALSALEMGCDAVIKATNVDGVYSANPNADPQAQRFDRITYQEVLERNLRVMDLTAIALLMDHDLPLVVMNIHTTGSLARLVRGEQVGTLVSN